MLEGYLNKHGRPVACYTDRAGLFQTAVKSKRGEQREGRDRPEMPPTQIGRALKGLGNAWIPAYSPQAKGRVERAFGTAQDRPGKRVRAGGASTLQHTTEKLVTEIIL